MGWKSIKPPHSRPAPLGEAVFIAAGMAFLLTACTAPRSVLNSAEALRQGGWQVGFNSEANIPLETTERLFGSLERGIEALVDEASRNGTAAISADRLNDFALPLLAYSVDPFTAQTGAYVRYGFWPRLDGGYHFWGGSHAFDLRWQFLGASAEDSVPAGQSRWQGSVGAQYSWQHFDLPSVGGLDKLQDLMGFDFVRRSMLVPVILGKPFGQRGRYGGFGFGAACNLSYIRYGADLSKLLERKSDGTTQVFAPLRGERWIPSYGGFASLRAGYRWVYFLVSYAAYWQDYGTFDLFGGKTASFAGWTYIPSLALEFRF